MNNIYFEIIAFFYIMKQDAMIKNFRKNFFTEPTIVNVFDTVKDFVGQYKTEPTAEQVIELVKINGLSETVLPTSVQTLWQSRNNVQKYEDSWLKEHVSAWGKWMSFYRGLENTIAYVQQLPQNVAYMECEEYVNRASNIFNNGATFNVNTSDGHDFFDVENHIITMEDTHTTGYKYLDLCLNGGFTSKGLYIFMGAPKVGKSMWLCNIAGESVKHGYNTIYITLEMSYQLVSQRIGANLLGLDIRKYNQLAQDKNFMKEAMHKFYQGYASMLKTPGKLIIEEFPTSSASASDIENFILKKEAELSNLTGKPFKFHNVCIDYVNIMRDQRGAGADNSYTKIKNICEDVRAMGQRNQWAVISLTQVNRAGQEASDLNMTNVSESSGLVATVDALFGIIQTTPMSASNVYYIKAIALRNSEIMGSKQKFDFNGQHLRITQNEEEMIPEGVDIPNIWTSATAHAASQVNAVNGNAKPVFNSKPAMVMPSQPQMDIPVSNLGNTEFSFQNQTAGAQLFGI